MGGERERGEGGVSWVDVEMMRAVRGMRRDLSGGLARGICRNISRDEVHQLVDQRYDLFLNGSSDQGE